MTARPRIALIHATPVAVDPIKQAFAEAWPEAETVNILDDSLSPDRARVAELTLELRQRIVGLAGYARRIGSDGILFTCSAFGEAIEEAAAVIDVPVLKPNQAMFDLALRHGRKIAMIATFRPSVAGMEQEFAAAARQGAGMAHLTSVVVEPAMAALRAGDADTHNRLVADRASELRGYDAIMLAHFSTCRAAPAVRSRVNAPVLTSPDASVAEMRRLVGAGM